MNIYNVSAVTCVKVLFRAWKEFEAYLIMLSQVRTCGALTEG
jgi:hypothetical protein